MARITVTLPDGKTEIIHGAIKFDRNKHYNKDGTFEIMNHACLLTRTYFESFVKLECDRLKIELDPEDVHLEYHSDKYFLEYYFDCNDIDVYNCIDSKKRDKIAKEKWHEDLDFKELRKIDSVAK